MNQPIVIQNITSTDQWRRIFQYVLSFSDEFTVTFPEGTFDVENPLMGGKNKFELLKNLEVKKSTEMVDGVVLSGKLNKDAATLLEDYMSPSYEGFKPILWNFSLLKDNEILLEVSDFTVGFLSTADPMMHFLENENIDINSLN